MTRLNLKQPRKSKNSKPKKKKRINQVIHYVAATAANHFDGEDLCELPIVCRGVKVPPEKNKVPPKEPIPT